MTIKAWPDITTGTSEVAKNVKIFWARWDKYLGATVLTKTVAPKNFLHIFFFKSILLNFFNFFFKFFFNYPMRFVSVALAKARGW